MRFQILALSDLSTAEVTLTTSSHHPCRRGQTRCPSVLSGPRRSLTASALFQGLLKPCPFPSLFSLSVSSSYPQSDLFCYFRAPVLTISLKPSPLSPVKGHSDFFFIFLSKDEL